jgi:hypothetical protein
VNEIDENQTRYNVEKQTVNKIGSSPSTSTPEIEKTSIWKKQAHVSFKKVVAFEFLFMMFGALIGAGIITAVLK